MDVRTYANLSPHTGHSEEGMFCDSSPPPGSLLRIDLSAVVAEVLPENQ